MSRINLEDACVLVISSHDHGSLAESLYFIQGQKISENSVLLVPPRLEKAIENDNTTTYEIWSDFDDLCRIVNEYKPDLVYMVSGYLLPLQGNLSIEEIVRFFQHCTRSGCMLTTSDPLAGTLAHITQETPDGSIVAKPSLDLSPRTLHLIDMLRASHQIVKHIPHIFPWAATPDPLNNHSNLGYFNPHYIERFNKQDSSAILEGLSSDQPFWLFALGPEDFKDATSVHSPQELYHWTADKFRFALSQQKNVVAVGPEEFIEAMRQEMGETKGLLLLPYLPFNDFSQLTYTAEKAFFWNVLSASAILRIFMGRPTFHFDIGHIGKSLESAYQEVVKLALGGCEPAMLDQKKPFSTADIEEQNERFQNHVAARDKQLSALPQPDALVEKLLESKKIPVWTFWNSEELPPLVDRCIKSWFKHLPQETYEIRILTYETFQDFLPFDLLDKVPHFFELRPAQQSDLLRLTLLKWHGGVWLDASIYLLEEPPLDTLQGQFYAPRFSKLDKNTVQSWLICAPRQNAVIDLWLEEFMKALNERRSIKLKLFSMSIYNGAIARLLRINDPQFKDYFLIYDVFERIFQAHQWVRKLTPAPDMNGISASMQPENVKFVWRNLQYALLIKTLTLLDRKRTWPVTQKALAKRASFNKFLVHRNNLPSISMSKHGKPFLYKLNASDRLLVKPDFDFESLASKPTEPTSAQAQVGG